MILDIQSVPKRGSKSGEIKKNRKDVPPSVTKNDPTRPTITMIALKVYSVNAFGPERFVGVE